jgi:hypothetical protein
MAASNNFITFSSNDNMTDCVVRSKVAGLVTFYLLALSTIICLIEDTRYNSEFTISASVC